MGRVICPRPQAVFELLREPMFVSCIGINVSMDLEMAFEQPVQYHLLVYSIRKLYATLSQSPALQPWSPPVAPHTQGS